MKPVSIVVLSGTSVSLPRSVEHLIVPNSASLAVSRLADRCVKCDLPLPYRDGITDREDTQQKRPLVAARLTGHELIHGIMYGGSPRCRPGRTAMHGTSHGSAALPLMDLEANYHSRLRRGSNIVRVV